MNDLAINWLIEQINLHQRNSLNQLWVVDENIGDQWRSLPSMNLAVICNRFDVTHQMKTLFNQVEFSDFDFSSIADNSLDTVFYRISKEKAVTHQVINEAYRCLKHDGLFIVAGYKNEGIKTYLEKVGTHWNTKVTQKKLRDIYTALIAKPMQHQECHLLDSSSYTTLRNIHTDESPIFSKPGQFGWNKLDAGSKLLLEALNTIPHELSGEVLDLGCGYGYLSLEASRLPRMSTISGWTLTDNNAAAILSATANCEHYHLSARVIPDDCAMSIQERFDLILCNPPFHQGFDVENNLTDKFLASAAKHLNPNGQCLFVVNQFIPLERKALPHFNKIEVLINDGKFKVVRLSL